MKPSMSLIERLQFGGPLVADGATGANLQAMGLPAGTPPEVWVMEQPERVYDLHRRFVEAGSDIILSCSFGANPFRLHEPGYTDRLTEINRRAAELARHAADESDREVFVAGSMGPTGMMLQPLGTLTVDDVAGPYLAQAYALAEGGADFLLLETFFALDEAGAALEGISREVGLPVVVTFSYDRGLRTMMGVRPEQMVEAIAAYGVAGIGANCGTTLENMEQIVEVLAAHTDLPIWAKPNAGIPEGEPPRYLVGPEQMASFALRYIGAGAKIVGGCCGTTPEHVEAIARAVKNRVAPQKS